MAKKRSKIIQVPMPEDMLYELDRLAQESGESRSHVIREAVVRYLADAEEAELDRQYEESFRKMPETEEERQWGQIGLQQLTGYYMEEEQPD